MKSSFSFIKDSVLLKMTIAVVAGVFLVVGTAGAATTISTNILTAGTLGAMGVSTFGATASTTISAAGVLTTPSAVVNGTLGVIGVSTFGATASTTISAAGVLTAPSALFNGTLGAIGVASFGATATSTFTAAGVLTLQNGETISNATNDTIAITSTNVTFSGLASSTTLKVGSDTVSTISGLIFGTCNLTTATITATSTGYATCTGATGVTSSYTVFVQATSSLPAGLVINAASTTGTTGTLSLRVNNVNAGADTATGGISVNFWAVR